MPFQYDAQLPDAPPTHAARAAIVVEGGAMRGIFSAGVLDVLLERGLTGVDYAIGTSAGACNLASFVCGQVQRNYRCYVDIMSRPQLFSFERLLRGGHYIDLDWLWERFLEEEPLALDRLASARMQLVSVATCGRTGRPHYVRCTPEAVWEPVKGSCAMPVLYRGPVHFDGQELVDGGLSAPIAVSHAYALGARRIVVVRSRPRGRAARASVVDGVAAALLAHRPALSLAMLRSGRAYAACERFIGRPPQDARVLELAPTRPLCTGATTQDRDKLRADYQLGRQVAEHALPALERVLG